MKPVGPVVLVVDDEEDICRNLADILGDIGCQVDTACDGKSAIELVRKRPYDVALLDLKMPGMSGLDLCHAIRDLRPGTVAILVTAYAGLSTPSAAQDAGFWRILSKPVDLPSLLGLVEEAAGQPTVLLVDDDRDLCSNLCDLFRDRRFRVSFAHDVEEATSLVREGRFQVVLIDMKLPSGTGIDVFRTVRDADPEVRTVLITGFRSETDSLIQNALDEGADSVCYKPFDIPTLLEKVQALSRRPNRPEDGPVSAGRDEW